jgi:DegV family protein with EDD domain
MLRYDKTYCEREGIMNKYIISCCSTADITEEHFKNRDIQYLCFHYELDGVEHLDDLGKTMPILDFYQAMVDGAETKTSQVNAEEYEEYFRKYLEQGLDVIHLTLSSGISGTINSAMVAKANLEEEFPDRKLYVVDSLAASSGFGLLVDKVADLRDQGMSIDQVYKWVEANKKRVNHWFFSTDLTFYIKGGRVSKTAGLIGGIMGICPLLNVDYEGRLIPRAKIKGKKKVCKAIVRKMEELADDRLDYADKVYICHSACIEDAQTVATMVEEKFPNIKGKVEINNIGTTIGSHTGPGTVALFFWGDERVD